MGKKKVLLGVTGSIAAYKACDLVRRLQDVGFTVSVVMTDEAKHFVTPLTFATLSGRAVHCDMFVRGMADASSGEWDMAHIALASWADLYVIAPATANVIGKMANGIADDLVTCTAITTKAPVLIAPAMNAEMFANGMVQRNIARLKDAGVHFVSPKKGKLACGDVGLGALAEVQDIVASVQALLK